MDKKEKFITAIKESDGFIYKIASAYTNNTDDRNDLIQEIIYQLWKSFDSFHRKSSLSTWIYRVALNVALYQLKVSKRRVQTVPIDEQDPDYHASDQTEIDENWKILRYQIDKLNLLDKGILVLHLENKSYDEIAEIIGITKTNVATKLSRIKEKIKAQINKTL